MLLDLPIELLIYCAGFLNPSDLVALGRVCHFLNEQIAKDECLWSEKLAWHFPLSNSAHSTITKKSIFVENAKQKYQKINNPFLRKLFLYFKDNDWYTIKKFLHQDLFHINYLTMLDHDGIMLIEHASHSKYFLHNLYHEVIEPYFITHLNNSFANPLPLGITDIHWQAICNPDSLVISRMNEKNAHQVTIFGLAPIHFAVKGNHPELVQKLWEFFNPHLFNVTSLWENLQLFHYCLDKKIASANDIFYRFIFHAGIYPLYWHNPYLYDAVNTYDLRKRKISKLIESFILLLNRLHSEHSIGLPIIYEFFRRVNYRHQTFSQYLLDNRDTEVRNIYTLLTNGLLPPDQYKCFNVAIPQLIAHLNQLPIQKRNEHILKLNSNEPNAQFFFEKVKQELLKAARNKAKAQFSISIPTSFFSGNLTSHEEENFIAMEGGYCSTQ